MQDAPVRLAAARIGEVQRLVYAIAVHGAARSRSGGNDGGIVLDVVGRANREFRSGR